MSVQQQQAIVSDFERHWGILPLAKLASLPETGVSVFRWSYPNERGEFFRAYRSDHYVVSLILRPMEARTWTGGKQIWCGPIAKDTVRIVHPGEEGQWRSESAFDLLHIVIPRGTIAQFARGQCADTEATDVRFSDPLYMPDDTICQIGCQMASAIAQDGPFIAEFVDGLSHALIAHTMRRYMLGGRPIPAPLAKASQLHRAIDFVVEHISREISVLDMANAAGMSPFHFSRMFRKAVGISPHRYVILQRIEKAKGLIRRKEVSILEVALESGFKDASHFSRVFRASVGMTPREFRADS